MEQEVVILVKVISKLKKLETILYKMSYFSFQDSCELYVNKIFDTIHSIPDLKHTKTHNPKYGEWFVRHKPNRKTTYYITFSRKADRYLIKNIISNHEEEYLEVVG